MKVDISKQPKRVVFSIEEKGNVISLVELIILPDILKIDEGRPVGYIHKVYTDKQYQGKGHASKLMGDAINYAKKYGCYKMFLITHLDQDRFYEQFGFEPSQCAMEARDF